ncbi:hypothetical protein DITRI_Ditri08aG0147300 [Diplodiscus trichospermus]
MATPCLGPHHGQPCIGPWSGRGLVMGSLLYSRKSVPISNIPMFVGSITIKSHLLFRRGELSAVVRQTHWLRYVSSQPPRAALLARKWDDIQARDWLTCLGEPIQVPHGQASIESKPCPPGSSKNRYVGIWYYQILEKTVVWVANRENPINDTSGILSIDSRGNLVLFQRNQTLSVWSTNLSITRTRNSIAQLLDSGNLVLLQNDTRTVLWQSFDYPTNVLLPSMKFGLSFRTGLNRVLTSWKSPDDPGIGNYSLRINPSGFPQFYLYKGSSPWWRAGSWTGRR